MFLIKSNHMLTNYFHTNIWNKIYLNAVYSKTYHDPVIVIQ